MHTIFWKIKKTKKQESLPRSPVKDWWYYGNKTTTLLIKPSPTFVSDYRYNFGSKNFLWDQ